MKNKAIILIIILILILIIILMKGDRCEKRQKDAEIFR